MKMKSLGVVLTTLFMMTLTTSANAQSLMERMAKKAAQKLEQKTEDRIDQKIDKGIDKSLDGVEESVKSDSNESRSTSNSSSSTNSEENTQRKLEEMMKKMGMSSEPVVYSDSYIFTSSIKMNIKTVNKRGKTVSDGDMVSYLSENDKQMAYEFVSGDIDVENAPKTKGVIILDFANQSTLILSNDNKEKTGIAYGIPDLFKEDSDNDTFDNEDVTPIYKKTGRTKSILGYKCEEYAYSDESSKGTFWVTNDYKAARSSGLPALFNRTGVAFGNANGFLMASESTNLKSGEKSTMEVTEINPKQETRFSTKEYQITNVGSIGMPSE